MYSIYVTTFGGRLIYGSCVTGPVPGYLLSSPELGPDVGNSYLDISSKISGLNEGLKRILFMSR